MADRPDLQRFLDAQAATHEQARTELLAGRKRSHWMWFIFPQLRGLGSSAMAERYAIGSRAEAASYLEHPVLGARLRELTGIVCSHADKPLSEIFGYPDDLKFCSSMTLFAAVAGEQDRVFAEALAKLCDGADPRTLQRLA